MPHCHFLTLTLEQAQYIKPDNAAPLRHLLDTNLDDLIRKCNIENAHVGRTERDIFVSYTSEVRWWDPAHTNTETYTSRTDSFKKLWTTKPTRQPKVTWPLIVYFQLDWLNKQARQAIEELFAELLDIIAKHRFEIGVNNDFKVKLTPIDESAAYSQSLPATINRKRISQWN